MYLPKHFEQHDRTQLLALMRARPLATLITTAADGTPCADLIPLEFHAGDGEPGTLRGQDQGGGTLRGQDQGGGTLRGHVARANPLWQRAGTAVLAVFSGPEAYISPGWYASKKEHGKVVPTWNYTMVQARGVLRAVDHAPWLHALVQRLTDHHEATQTEPWQVSDAPDDYVQQMLRAIVGIEIALTSLVGKWKVSQNRSTADRESTAAGLTPAHPEMATLVRGDRKA
jgi:transcriptional regulator